MKPGKSVPGGIIIIIGAVFTFIGVTYIAFCMSLLDETAAGIMGAINNDNFESPATRTTFVTVMGVITFVLAICASIYAFKHNMVGGILSAVATVMLIVLAAVLNYWGVMMILSIIFLGVGSILTFFIKKPIPEKPQPPQPGMAPPPPQGGWQQPPQGGWQQPPQQGGWQQPPQQGGWQQPPQNNWQAPPQQNNWQQPPQNGQGPNNPPPNNWQPPQG